MWVTFKDDASLRWRMLLALLLGAFLAGMILSLVLAAQRVSKVVDRLESGSRNTRWTISASLAGKDLQVKVLDRAGAPVPGGTLSFEPQRPHPAPPVQLAELSPGVFHTPRPLAPQGELSGTLRFTCGDAVATRKLVLFN